MDQRTTLVREPRAIPASSASGWALYALFVLVIVALQATTFGDTNRHADETFYFLVGQRMHEGVLPYVEVWDRKPFGLFAFYYLIAAVSHSVLAYQLVACLLAGAAALLIARMVERQAGLAGGVLAGLSYLLVSGPFEGGTGQTPDIYNPLIAGAALLIARELPQLLRGIVRPGVPAAMALCGLALTIKQTALFESAYFGLTVLLCLHHAGLPGRQLARVATVFMLIGALPTLVIAGFYWLNGHWFEFWHAMVVSNLKKAAEGGEAWRALGNVLRAAVLLAFAAGGLLFGTVERRFRVFLAGWIIAALIGFLSVPNFYSHYTLPLLVPLCVAAGLLFGRLRQRFVLFVALAAYALLWNNPDKRAWTQGSVGSMDALASAIGRLDTGGGLLVFDGPHYLYALANKPFLSPLVFPHHLNHLIEKDVSHLVTHDEVVRILSNRPGVIVLSRYPHNRPVNQDSRRLVLAWARAHCPAVEVIDLVSQRDRVPMVLYGRCSEGRRPDTQNPPG